MELFDDPTTLRGCVIKFWFRSAESGFGVAQFQVDATQELVAVRGPLGELSESQPVELRGAFEDHPRYGRQFRVEQIEIRRPEGKDAVRSYLASGAVKGVGPSLAERIVKALGEDAIEVIETDPDALKRVHGIGPKKAREIHESVKSQMSLREVMLFLHGHDLSPNLAHRVIKAYGDDAIRLLKNNPYRLADDIVGIGFRRADEVAGKLGIDPDAEERKQAGILYALSQAVGRDGNCCLPRSVLAERAAALLGQPVDSLELAFAALLDAKRIVAEKLPGLPVLTDGEEERVYPLTLHVAETGVTAAIQRLATQSTSRLVENPEQSIATFERRARFKMPGAQREAVATGLRAPFCVITGGPGVGKTTIIRALTSIAEAAGHEVALAAPTGRAAKRLSEATGRPASTVHRLLEYQPIGRFGRNEHNPLEHRLVVIDETSMLDLPLAYNLCRATPPGTHVVFVGDVDQLPSVGPGSVLSDLIASGRVPVVRLTEIFRQQAGSRIITNAHRILEGRLPDLDSGQQELTDFYFIEQRDPEQSLSTILRCVTDRIPRAFGLDPMADVQVLCPMYRGPLGVDSINEQLGRVLVPGGTELRRGARRFRVGDKVLQVRNNYDLDLFNGDPGRVRSIDLEAKKLVVSFAGRNVTLGGDDLDQIVLAYGITVHRAQGSEYPAVVLPLDTAHYLLLNRRLLYTAVTRAKRLLILVGSRWALERAVGNDEDSARFTGLRDRLAALVVGDGVHPDRGKTPEPGGSRLFRSGPKSEDDDQTEPDRRAP